MLELKSSKQYLLSLAFFKVALVIFTLIFLFLSLYDIFFTPLFLSFVCVIIFFFITSPIPQPPPLTFNSTTFNLPRYNFLKKKYTYLHYPISDIKSVSKKGFFLNNGDKIQYSLYYDKDAQYDFYLEITNIFKKRNARLNMEFRCWLNDNNKEIDSKILSQINKPLMEIKDNSETSMHLQAINELFIGDLNHMQFLTSHFPMIKQNNKLLMYKIKKILNEHSTNHIILKPVFKDIYNKFNTIYEIQTILNNLEPYLKESNELYSLYIININFNIIINSLTKKLDGYKNIIGNTSLHSIENSDIKDEITESILLLETMIISFTIRYLNKNIWTNKERQQFIQVNRELGKVLEG